MLSFDEHGHHKPIHKHPKASQKCGPYTLSRGSSLHSLGSPGSLGNKSLDNLHYHGSASIRSRNGISSPPSDMAESKQPSPSPSMPRLNGLPPLDLSSISYPEYTPTFDLFGNASDHETPMFSAGLSSVSIDWTQYDGLELNGDAFGASSFDPAQSYTGFDPAGSVEPTLTSNSGDVSESEEFVPAFGDPQLDSYRSNATSYLDLSQSQAAMLTSADLGAIEFDQFKGTAAATTKFLANAASFDDASPAFPPHVEDDTYWNINSFDDGIAQSPDPVASGLWMESV